MQYLYLKKSGKHSRQVFKTKINDFIMVLLLGFPLEQSRVLFLGLESLIGIQMQDNFSKKIQKLATKKPIEFGCYALLGKPYSSKTDLFIRKPTTTILN